MARKSGSHSDITGPRIRRAAERLIARHGFAAVTMRQIASEVGVQAGALYLYTPDKQTLLFDLMREHMEGVLQAWEVEDKPADPLGRLQAFTLFHIRHHLDRPDAVFISYMELRNLEPGNYEVIAGLRGAYEDALEAILRQGADAQEFRVPDISLAAKAVIAMLTGVNTWYREGGRLSRDRVERIYWNMVRRAVGA